MYVLLILTLLLGRLSAFKPGKDALKRNPLVVNQYNVTILLANLDRVLKEDWMQCIGECLFLHVKEQDHSNALEITKTLLKLYRKDFPKLLTILQQNDNLHNHIATAQGILINAGVYKKSGKQKLLSLSEKTNLEYSLELSQSITLELKEADPEDGSYLAESLIPFHNADTLSAILVVGVRLLSGDAIEKTMFSSLWDVNWDDAGWIPEMLLEMSRDTLPVFLVCVANWLATLKKNSRTKRDQPKQPKRTGTEELDQTHGAGTSNELEEILGCDENLSSIAPAQCHTSFTSVSSTNTCDAQKQAHAPQAHTQTPQAHAQAPQAFAKAQQAHAQAPHAHAQAQQAHVQASQAHAQAPQAHAQAPQAHTQAQPQAHAHAQGCAQGQAHPQTQAQAQAHAQTQAQTDSEAQAQSQTTPSVSLRDGFEAAARISTGTGTDPPSDNTSASASASNGFSEGSRRLPSSTEIYQSFLCIPFPSYLPSCPPRF